VLSIDDLALDELRVEPAAHPAYLPEDFVDGAWMSVSFWDRNESGSAWSTWFRLGHPEDVVTAEDCFGE
jgi:hypothetical protein